MTNGEDPGMHIMSVAARTATLLAFPSARATAPFSSTRAHRTSAGVRTSIVQAPARTTPLHPMAARETVPAGMLRRLAMAVGLGAMLVSTGAGGVTVDRLDGAAALHTGEAATVTANRVTLDGLDVAAGGGSSVMIRKGRVGRLSTVLSEGSSPHADVVAASARLIARGGAGIDVARVDGVLDRVADEGGTVTVHVASAAQGGDAPAAPRDPDAAHGLRSRAGDSYGLRIHPDAPGDAADRDAAGGHGRPAWRRAG